MASLIRYHLDENVTTVLASALRRAGIEVSTSQEAQLLAAPDDQQLAHAHQSGRVLVTRDHDFLRLAQFGTRHSGIAYWHPAHQSISRAVSQLTLLWRTTMAEEMVEQVFFLQR
jgi:hypothetical protein